MDMTDDFGWPDRRGVDGIRRCARPSCESEEYRIDGYCSHECRNYHEYEEEIDSLRVEVERLLKERDSAESKGANLRAYAKTTVARLEHERNEARKERDSLRALLTSMQTMAEDIMAERERRNRVGADDCYTDNARSREREWKLVEGLITAALGAAR